MSKANVLKQYQRALAKWPADALRPDISFSKIIQKNVEQRLGGDTAQVNLAKEEAQVNALFTLLEDRYTKKYPLSKRILEPKSNPDYYKNLVREIEEAPNRSWFQTQISKWKGFLRLK